MGVGDQGGRDRGSLRFVLMFAPSAEAWAQMDEFIVAAHQRGQNLTDERRYGVRVTWRCSGN